MQLLPKWVLPPALPSVYDSESMTVLEVTAKLYGAMNTLIKEYNEFADTVNKKLNTFTETEKEAREEFEKQITELMRNFQTMITERIGALESDISAETTKIVNQAIRSGVIVISENYDPETESLTIAVSGGIE